MEAQRVDHELPGELARHLGCLRGDGLWLETLIRLFPIPTTQHVHHLIFSVERLARAVPWLFEGLGGSEFIDPMRRIADAVRVAHRERVLGESPRKKDFVGKFLRTGTLLQEQSQPLGHLESLRAVVFICAWQWAQTPRARDSVVEDLARAVRGIVRTPSGRNAIEDGLLVDLVKMARDPAARLPGEATDGSSETFRNAWNDHALPEIRSLLARTQTAPMGAPLGNGVRLPVAPKPRGGRRDGDGAHEDQALARQLVGYRRRLYRSDPGRELEPGESQEEVRAPVDLMAALFVPRNPDAKKIVPYQVRQAIWGRNRFLLPSHPDALQIPVLVQVWREALALLESNAPGPRAGLLGLLLQGLTGRTTKSLRAMQILPTSSGLHEANRFDLLLQEGELRYSVFWQVPLDSEDTPAHFRPSQDQQKVLEDVESVYSLPLVAPLANAFRQAAGELKQFLVMDPPEIQTAIREAARTISERVGIPFTPGQVRASFAVHVYERSRDVALTQLLAADTLGQSIAPLSYYAPRVARLREVFWEFQVMVVGTEQSGPVPAYGRQRVGSTLQVRPSVAARMARVFGAPLRLGVSNLVETGMAHQVHAAITSHLLGMLVAGLTHRPTKALFDLRRSDFLIEGSHGAALFRDKSVDGAHDPRLVALPPLALKQLNAYLVHLETLAKIHPPLEPHVQGILRGEQSLFFFWDGWTNHGALDLSQWKSRLPGAWRMLPLNWGRHWCRTKAVELGIRPELVNMQMGHLEAVDYPFSDASPAEPALFVEALGTEWERVLRSQGWQLVRGLSGDDRQAASRLPPLRHWDGDARAHEALQADAAKRWRAQFRATMRDMRERALGDVLAHPELMQNGISARYANLAKSQPKHSLSRTDFERLRDQFLDEGDGTLELGLARAAALCRVVRTVNRRTGQSSEDPPRFHFPRRPLDNAFFPGMLIAVRQVRAMREHLSEWSEHHKPGPWREFPLACARVTLALTLFGFCDDPEQISGAIERRGRAQRSAVFPDLLLVPYGDEAHQVLPLRGITAIAMAHLASKHGGEGFPGWKAVAPHLEMFLPAWTQSSGREKNGAVPELVTCLCETVATANRFELSPAARLAIGAEAISTQAHVREQIALIDGDPSGSLSREWLSTGRDDEVSDAPMERAKTSTGHARTQYLALCAVFSTRDSDLTLPLTGGVIPSGQASEGRHRAAILAEIDAMLEQKGSRHSLQPVVRLLATWCRDMLLHGTARTKTPALATISTYLTRIGGVLVHVLGHSRLDCIDELELEHAYMAAVESKSDPAAAAASTLSLHRFGQRYFGLPEIDLTPLEVVAHANTTARADARLILPSERHAVVEQLADWATGGADISTPENLRIYRQAMIFGELIGRTGARRSEILGLEARDVSHGQQGVHIRIRRNASRRLKTHNARRNVVARLSEDRRERLRSWTGAETQRLAPAVAERSFLFPPLHNARSAEGRDKIASACLDAIKVVTGMYGARLHHFRHLFAIEAISPVFLTAEDRERLLVNLSLVDTPTWNGGFALPRDLMAQAAMLGHADPRTSLAWYHHVAFLLRSRPDAVVARRYLTVNTIATVLGVTRDAPKAAQKKRSSGQGRAERWLDQRMAPRRLGDTLQMVGLKIEGNDTSPQRWTAKQMASLLDAATRSGRLESALLAFGGSPGRADVLRAAILVHEMRIGRRLVEDDELARISHRPKRRIRSMHKASEIEQWWDIYDQGPSEKRDRILAVARAVGEHMVPGDRDWIRVPQSLLPGLIRLIGESGFSDEHVQQERLGSGIARLRLRCSSRRTAQNSRESLTAAKVGSGQERYLGLSIKRILVILLLVQDPI